MAPAYTTTSSHPNITPSVVFDFGAQIISVPISVGIIDGQWLINHARQAEESSVGQAYPAIAVGSGKVEIDTDIVTGLPIFTGVLGILKSGWLIQTLKTSGRFVITDVFKSGGALPYLDTAGIDIRYRQTLNSTVTSTNTGGGGFTGSDRATLNKLILLYEAMGLEPGVEASVLDATDEANGYLRTSNGSIDNEMIKQVNGSVVIRRKV